MKRAAWPLMVSVVIVGILFLAVFPTRTYLGQRRDLAATQQRLEVLNAENARLAARVERLNTDQEIERLAREQYSLVKPGEEAYAILPSPQAAAAVQAAPEEEADDPGFWSRVWDDVTFWS
ncbi:MAG TPA: septum formation initiator family protein [Acidimicrobiales bacterium]|nr:septum formation initiator family protein [Acidimicrobiales bacterium]